MNENSSQQLLEMDFPAYRSEEWIRENYDKMSPPEEVLKGVNLAPKHMMEFEQIYMYKHKVESVKNQLRVALFRQALFKVQNLEVTFMDECKSNRILKKVMESQKPLWNPLDSADNPLIREEIWTIERCGVDVDYRVRFLKEGDNGFNSQVFPTRLQEMIAMAK